ncbi:Carboxylesterase type B [Penicillium freii]|nr:Carboxylesterase type B [Penicillium freii]
MPNPRWDLCGSRSPFPHGIAATRLSMTNGLDEFISAMAAGSTLNFAAAYGQVYRQDSSTKPRPIAEQNALGGKIMMRY